MKHASTRLHKEMTLGLMALSAGCVSQPVVQNTDVSGPACHRDLYAQAAAKTDILIVKDTSGSMADENEKIAASLEGFIASLPSNLDFRVSVLLANAGNTKAKGHLAKRPGDSWILDSKQMSREELSFQLRLKMMVSTDVKNHGEQDNASGEAGLNSVNRILDHGKVQSARAKGFFRKDAALMVLFVSDNQDYCSDSARSKSKACDVKSPAQFDGNGNKVSSAVREQVTPQLIAGKLRRLQGDRPLAVGAVGYLTGSSVAGRVGKGVGYGYLEVAELSNGFKIDLSRTDMQGEFQQIGAAVSNTAESPSEFPLANSNVDPLTVSVLVNGQSVAFAYQSEGNAVQLTQAPGFGAVVEVNYCVLPVGSPDEAGGSGDGTSGSDDDSTGTGSGDDSTGTGSGDDSTGTGSGDDSTGTGSGDDSTGSGGGTGGEICTGLDCGFIS